MRDKLKCIFELFDFELITMNDNYDFYKPSPENKRKEYYLVKNIEEENFNKNTIRTILDIELLKLDIKANLKDGYENEMAKNTSIIFTVKLDNLILNDKQKNLIFEIEENPYLYKKYVVWYSSKELEQFKNYRSKKDMLDELFAEEMDEHNKLCSKFDGMRTLLSLINDSKNNENNIEQIKKLDEKKIYGYYLLTKLFIKLPFLNLRNKFNFKNNSSELEKLKNKIHQDLLESEFYDEVFNDKKCNVEIDEDRRKKIKEEILNSLEGELNEL